MVLLHICMREMIFFSQFYKEWYVMQLLKELYVFRREEKKQCKIGCMVELNYNFLIYQSED